MGHVVAVAGDLRHAGRVDWLDGRSIHYSPPTDVAKTQRRHLGFLHHRAKLYDAVSHRTASGRTGGDILLTEEVIRGGSRLITKLWNAARLVLPYLEGYRRSTAPTELLVTDRWLMARLMETVQRATVDFEKLRVWHGQSGGRALLLEGTCATTTWSWSIQTLFS